MQQAKIGLKDLGAYENLSDAEKPEAARRLCEIALRHLNPLRYLDEDHKLLNPEIYRKFLVFEYRFKVILRKGQREEVIKLAENPCQWRSLRMGEGKTFFIMPILAAILSERGTLPIMLVPTQLESLNQKDFDRTTLKTFGSRAVPLRIDLQASQSSTYLAQIYANILTARRNRNYLVSTVSTLASLRSLTTLLRLEKQKFYEKISTEARVKGKTLEQFVNDSDDADLLKYYLEWRDFSLRLLFAKKIEQLFDGHVSFNINGKHVTKDINVQFFGDEIDSILHISKEINRGIGEPQKVDERVRSVTSALFSLIMQDEDLSAKLNSGSQTTISKIELENKLNGFASILLSENSALFPPAIQNLSLEQKEELVTYLMGKGTTLPDTIRWEDDNEHYKRLAALKHLLSVTMTKLFDYEPGQKFKLDEATGCLAVPAELGQENEGNRFGDEYELIAFHYLAHIQASLTCAKNNYNTQLFYTQALRKMKDVYPQEYANIVENIPAETVNRGIEAISKYVFESQNMWESRLLIVDKIIFNEGIVMRFRQQIAVSAPDIVGGERRVGGISGTLLDYGLPKHDIRTPTLEATRQVEMETYLKVCLLQENGANQPVEPLSDTESEALNLQFQAMLQNADSAAIVNEGAYGLGGKNIRAWILQLKELNPIKDLVWLEEDENHTTKIFLLESTANAKVTEISKEELKIRIRPFIGIYGPQFTRGSDLPLNDV